MASGREPVDPWALISAEEQASIKKMSDVRLRENLGGAGVQQAKLDTMDRTALLEEWARVKARMAQVEAATATLPVTPVNKGKTQEEDRG